MHAWIDAGAGIAGDMLLGALIDAGADVERVRDAVRAVDPGLDLDVRATTRHSLHALKVTVLDQTGLPADALGETASHDHGPGTGHHHGPDHHEHPHRPHRSFAEVRRLLAAADLTETVRDRALAVFTALARAEGAVHGVDPEEVHFHEVGALDAIGDIVGCAAALTDLGVTALTCSPVALGGGEQARGEHGRVPIPGPAVLHLVSAAGIPVYGGALPMELATPTGVAMLAAWCDDFGPLPPMRVGAIGAGAGTRDPAESANLCRVLLAADEPDRPRGPGEISEPAVQIVLATNVDDLDPRVWPVVLERLLAAGAADAWLTPILMKKGRPAYTLEVLCDARLREEIIGIVAAESTAIGMREYAVTKHALERRTDTVLVHDHPVRVKIASLGGRDVNAQPEFEDCAALARELGVPVKDVLAEATAAHRRPDSDRR